MVKLGAVVLNVGSNKRSAAFWGPALGYQPASNPAFLVPADGSGTRLHLDEDDRTHLDLWVADDETLEEEVERLVSLGARRVEWTYPEGADFVVLADPGGTLFCVIDR